MQRMPEYQFSRRKNETPRGFVRSLILASCAVALAAAVTLGGEMQAEKGPYRLGDVVPDFTLSALDGGDHTLSERRVAGPVVLVFFRGAW